MALTSWKAFKFFDSSEVTFADADASDLFTKGEVRCICTGSDNVFVACSDGQVRILSKAFKIIRAFQAHDNGSITHMKQVENTSLLVTIAEDLTNEPTLKVWTLDKLDKKTGIPRCSSTISIHNSEKGHPISAFAALDNLSQLGIGFGNGAVTVIRGDLIHDRGTKQRTVFESDEPITGIQFREGNTTALYIATTARILTLIISGRGQGQPARTLDEVGCAVGCMTIDKATRDIIVARDDAIYYYGLHGRGSYYNVDGHKTLLTTHQDYVGIVSPSSTTSISKSTLVTMPPKKPNDKNDSYIFTLLNTDFHFIAHAETMSSNIERCFAEWDELFLHTADGKLLRYREKPLQQRLDLLFQRNLYVLAIQIAQQAGVDTAQQNIIFRKYGDYLFQAKDYDTAMQQYLRAIENTEPSQIIRKFLDTQRIPNLIDYLEELHEHHRATADHTILLLNCYAKLKDVEKLEAFIKSPGETKFDLDTAISMCRQSGYFDQAAYLARKHSEHDLVVSVLVEDSKKYAEALAYIWRLEPETAYVNFLKYGTVLLEHCSEDTTHLFIDYYTGRFKPKKDAVVVTPAPTTSQNTNAATSAVQNLASLLPLPYMSMSSNEKAGSTEQKMETRVIESQDDEPPPEYDIPKPRTAFSAFVDHPKQFLRFLEACVLSDKIQGNDKADLYTALFEMYVRTANEKDGVEQSEWENKAKQLLENSDIPIDTSNVLLLSDLGHFRDGTVLVREQQGLHFDIFRSYTSANDTAGAIKALKKYGPNEPRLYPAALAYFTSSRRALEEAGDEFGAVLQKIERDNLMAPLQVIQTLSSNEVATMGLVKKYLQDAIGREREQIANNQRDIASFRDDTRKRRSELHALTTKPHEFKATRCSACGYALDPPTVHFLCDHSYHQRCLNIAEGETIHSVECPRCAPQNATIRAIKQGQENSKEQHELFKEQLRDSKDRFTVVADWFGRGVMSVSGSD